MEKLSKDLVLKVIKNRFAYRNYKGYSTYTKLMKYYDKLIDKKRQE